MLESFAEFLEGQFTGIYDANGRLDTPVDYLVSRLSFVYDAAEQWAVQRYGSGSRTSFS